MDAQRERFDRLVAAGWTPEQARRYLALEQGHVREIVQATK